MRVKAVIWKPDHMNDVVVVNQRKTRGRTFRHNGSMYFLHPDRFQVTWRAWLFGLFKLYFSTYYYTQGRFMPWPVPDGQTVNNGGAPTLADRVKLAKEHGLEKNGSENHDDYTPMPKQELITGEELAALFNPFFYETIAATQKDTWDKVLWYAAVLGACGTFYLIWRLHQSGVFG